MRKRHAHASRLVVRGKGERGRTGGCMARSAENGGFLQAMVTRPRHARSGGSDRCRACLPLAPLRLGACWSTRSTFPKTRNHRIRRHVVALGGSAERLVLMPFLWLWCRGVDHADALAGAVMSAVDHGLCEMNGVPAPVRAARGRPRTRHGRHTQACRDGRLRGRLNPEFIMFTSSFRNFT